MIGHATPHCKYNYADIIFFNAQIFCNVYVYATPGLAVWNATEVLPYFFPLGS